MDFFAKRKAMTDGTLGGDRVPEAFEKNFPLVSTMLLGRGKYGDADYCPRFTLSLFAGEGEIRFAFSEKEGGETWFGSAGDSSATIASVELALLECRVEKKREKSSARGARY